ncbi:hypothetical protein Trco_006464 [Trichoderma cornu-damae]|uniref:Zn(2)-C6 fungal-type domain-containing protein n=1 Tax=Trichoderma cornu-damae TaxID=654480 RepID=A0A9P8QLI7_9HYPO|nr:hypothetical protein Trco_006464 [Trichoderma cornu-damae]
MDSFGGGADTSPLGSLGLGPRRPDRMSADGGSTASRQKSCNACVRGKRRCDKRTPRCTRCAAKGLDCVYQRQPPQQAQPRQHQSSPMASATIPSSCASAVEGGCGSPKMAPDFDMSFDIESSLSTTSGTNTSPESLQQDVGLQLGGEPQSHHEHAAHADIDFSIVDLMNASAGGPGSFKIGFIVKVATDMYVEFTQRREAPFMHPRLWAAQLPKTIMTTFAAATAYSTRTAQTKGWAFKVVLDAVREVHRDGERATTPADRLARVQALLLLNSMRIFDGDVSLRASAEREMYVMLAWVKDLVVLKNELEEGLPASALMAREKPPKSWDSWIMVECTRRTVMLAFSVMCLFFVLKSEEAPGDCWENGHSFTASRHLWEAPSSVEFFRAWREKPQYCITDLSFKEFWMYARPDDVDEFTKLLLTTQVGVDAMEHFMEGETTIPIT